MNKYNDIIKSCINGNWTYNTEKVKHWSWKERYALELYAKKIEQKEIINKLFNLIQR